MGPANATEAPEVLVVGGGPAGAAAARLLALRGHSVQLLTRTTSGGRDLAESLPPSSGRLIEVLGATEAVASAGFLPAGGNTVSWAGGTVRSESFAEGGGWQVRKSVLATLLVDLAREAGAQVHEGATVVRISDPTAHRPAGSERGGLRVDYHEGDGRNGSGNAYRSVQPQFVLDCTGRAGALGSRFRGALAGRPTLALVGVWKGRSSSAVPSRNHTTVESYAQGWAWSIPVDQQHRYVTLMVDPEVTRFADGAGLENTYRNQLRSTALTAQVVREMRQIGRVSIWGATPYAPSRFCGPGFFLVGDAGAFIDPLSSYGVKRALASAWSAATAVHTSLADPAREFLSRQFFEERERRAVRGCQAQALTFYRAGAEVYGGDFWWSRSTLPESATMTSLMYGGATGARTPLEDVEDEASASPDVASLRTDPRVTDAHRALRSAPRVDLRPAPDITWTKGSAIQDDRIVAETRLVGPSFPVGLRFLRDIDVVHLVGLLDDVRASEPDSACGVPELYDAYEQTKRRVPLPDFIGALCVLMAEGIITNEAVSEPAALQGVAT